MMKFKKYLIKICDNNKLKKMMIKHLKKEFTFFKFDCYEK